MHLRIFHRNRLFRECLASVLSEVEEFDAADVDHADAGAVRVAERRCPDVVLIDLHLPRRGAIELTRRFRQASKPTKVILLGRADLDENLVECVAAGAHACVLEDASLQNLQGAIEKVVAGETFCSPEIVHTMFRRLAQTARGSRWSQRIESVDLTPRELEIVHLIADGLGNKQIARRLSLSIYTVKNHVHNIVEKLHVQNRFEAVQFADRQGWLKASRVVKAPGGG